MPNKTFSLEELLKECGFSPSEIETVKKGKLVKGVMDSLSERELAVKFAFKISPSSKDMDLHAKTPDAFMESKWKKVDPAVYEIGHLIEGDEKEPFADLNLEPNPDGALKLYRKAAPGDDLNLSQLELAQFQNLGKSATREQVEATIRQQLTRRLNEYRELGMKGIQPYQRSRSKSYSPGEELAHKTEVMPFMAENLPECHKYVLEYPNAPKPEGMLESFSWTVSVFDDLPTIALVHKIGYMHDDVFIFFQRMFYVSRSHNSVQGAGGAFPCEGGGVIFVYGTRTSTDKVAGFGGSAKRTIGARIMSSKQAENFERMQQMFANK